MTNAQRELIEALEQDQSLAEPHRLRQRVEALDRLEACFPDEPDADASALARRARAIRTRLEAVNHGLCQVIRREIRLGAGRSALLPWRPVSDQGGHTPGPANGEGYDYLDELVAGVLQFEPSDEAVAELAAEMVFYQPTPARHAFDLIERLALERQDVLIDLGSGLGHVPLLAAICTDARCIGIELEVVYVEGARRSAEALNLANVTFIRQDARAADLSSGTVFYLYTPFTGTVLRTVLDALQQEAANREIRICSYGPCTSTLAGERWLQSAQSPENDRIAIFHSRR
ncbi:methyltransferase domain-containing protein [Rhodanobacter sp. Col0626]|uniref:methyltransferase domain-containing protein n=1 Tax=Rhodanobacter sp. Col0626 TaxID=3415679 RepID=UPI003CF6D640